MEPNKLQINDDLPAWDLKSIYENLDSPILLSDFDVLEKNISILASYNQKITNENTKVNEKNTQLIIGLLTSSLELCDITYDILLNIFSFLKCEINIDSKNDKAINLNNRFSQILAEYNNQGVLIESHFANTSQDTITELLKNEKISSWKFFINETKRKSEITLSPNEEKIINTLNVNGILAWSKLYDKAVSATKVILKTETNEIENISLSKARLYLQNENEEIRKQAYLAIKDSFELSSHIYASCLNAIAGARLDIAKARSFNREVHFLEESLSNNLISQNTLNTIWSSLEKNNPGKIAAQNIAKFIGKTKLDPWDFNLAKLKNNESNYLKFDKAIELITEAFRSIDSEMSDFVIDMKRNNNIEARILDSKKSGANCSHFPKSQTSKVYMSYTGSLDSAIILAHELGHAYQNHITRHIPRAGLVNSLALSETASTLAEISLLNFLKNNHKEFDISLDELLFINSQNVMLYLLDIPTRFHFENEFYEKRKSNQLSPKEFSELMTNCSLSRNGDFLNSADSISWATKAHYYMTKTFYNYPYVFGYLFSHGIFALKSEMKDDFLKNLKTMVCDFGKMSAEDLAKTHLNIDISNNAFWDKSLRVVQEKVI